MSREPIFRLNVLAVAASVLSALLGGCGRTAAKPPQPPPPVVTVASVEQREIIEWEEFTGRTEAVETVEVRPRVSGHIQEVRFQSGQLVRKGDVLFVIDPRWHKAEFDRRQAEYEQARVRLENAERKAARSARLLASKAISTETADTSESQFLGSQGGTARREVCAGICASRPGIHRGSRANRWSRQPGAVDGRQLCQRHGRRSFVADDDCFRRSDLCLRGCG